MLTAVGVIYLAGLFIYRNDRALKTPETQLPYFGKKERTQSSRLIALYKIMAECAEQNRQYKKSNEIYKEIIVYLENQK
ncbi:hypothetical protein J6TS2_04700 [Heyndrickxia sporothermodurans]|nr:hypothetical protein J6TS2_04700 [Heyndrickxia sporothermodurans]